MSMNLHCDEVELIQTPTYITYMIYSPDENGEPCGGWRGILYRLKQWYGHKRQEAFNSAANDPEKQRWIETSYFSDIKHLDDMAARGPLTFYIM